MLSIDGRTGEGGGQLLRTCLSLSALTGRPFRIDYIRGNRSRPGLRPQHLTAVRAAARLCAAELSGATLDSVSLLFRPQTEPKAGAYRFDVSDAARGGSAGSVMLIWQTLLWPLLFAGGPSTLHLRGGTHVPMSPSFHYVRRVSLPSYQRFGVSAKLGLESYGWYPQGKGRVMATIEPVAELGATTFAKESTTTVEGVAVATNLPSDIPQRMAGRAANLLRAAGLESRVTPQRERAAGPGAGTFLWTVGAGGSGLGRKGRPSEAVAEAAVAEIVAFMDNTAAVDRHLADQLLLPAALARGRTSYTTDRLTNHTVTQAQLLQHWLDVNIEIDGDLDQPATITVQGMGFGLA